MVTNYPGSLDSFTRPGQSDLMNASGVEGDVVVDNLYDAVEAVQAELGTDPAGAQATVKARLDEVQFGPAGQFVWPSQGYISNSIFGSYTTGTTATSADGIYYAPLFCPRSVTIDRIGIWVSTGAAGANFRLAIYTATSDGLPGSLVTDFSAAEVDASTNGLKTLTVSQSMSGGVLYWLATHAESGSTYLTTAGTTAIAGSRAIRAYTSSANPRVAYSESVAYSSGFPSTASASPSDANLVMFMLRRS